MIDLTEKIEAIDVGRIIGKQKEKEEEADA